MTDDRPSPGTPGPPGSDTIRVFYDGACPLCTREIGFYRRRQGADRVRWIDVSGHADGAVADGLSKRQALARFHVQDSDGTLVSGAAAFTRLWDALPGFRGLARLCRLRPVAWVLEWAYRGFLKIRYL